VIPPLLLALLIASGIALWVFRQTSEDVYFVLAIAMLALGFIVGFAHAHWGLQIVIATSLLVIDRIYGRGCLRQSEID
jgi:hypothetical protein